MNIEKEALKASILYHYYSEKKKELKSIRQEAKSQIHIVCHQFSCNICPLTEMCKDTGGFADLNE